MNASFEPREARLLDEYQRGLALVSEPFAAIGRDLGADETWVRATLARWQRDGQVSRVGAVFRPGPLGASTLAALAGRTHRVLTAVALHDGRRVHTALNVSRVHFAPLPAEVIERYVAGGEPFGKAGAYAIQGPLAGWITHIEGSHSGIMGLPLFETAALLRDGRVAFGLAAA